MPGNPPFSVQNPSVSAYDGLDLVYFGERTGVRWRHGPRCSTARWWREGSVPQCRFREVIQPVFHWAWVVFRGHGPVAIVPSERGVHARRQRCRQLSTHNNQPQNAF